MSVLNCAGCKALRNIPSSNEDGDPGVVFICRYLHPLVLTHAGIDGILTKPIDHNCPHKAVTWAEHRCKRANYKGVYLS